MMKQIDMAFNSIFLQEKVTLLINHLLVQDRAAWQRLQPHVGRIMWVHIPTPQLGHYKVFRLGWRISAAGLLEIAESVPQKGSESLSSPKELVVQIDLSNPLQILRHKLDKRTYSPVAIHGEALFAADISWVIGHLEWDFTDDLARLGGPWAAYGLTRAMEELRIKCRQVSEFVRPHAGSTESQHKP